jgi:hypothetical protein
MRSRESQEHESDSFKSIFKEGIVYLKGNGAYSGKRLLLVKGRTHHVSAQEVDLGSDALNRYTLEKGLHAIIVQKCSETAQLGLPSLRSMSHLYTSMPPQTCFKPNERAFGIIRVSMKKKKSASFGAVL